MAKATKKDQPHYKKMNSSEKSIEARLKKELGMNASLEELEDVIVGLKAEVTRLTDELKLAKAKLKKTQTEAGYDVGTKAKGMYKMDLDFDYRANTATQGRAIPVPIDWGMPPQVEENEVETPQIQVGGQATRPTRG